jgi:malate dehydrogenase (oxaloacetate-decarboxylating)
MLAPGRAYSLHDAIVGSDIVIGVSRAGMISPEDIRTMNDNAIIFALANPEPEIMPEAALAAGAAIIATGRSDYPNQVNNVLAFPGIFRGALDNKVSQINVDHKIAAAMAIAGLVENPSPTEIIPNVLNPKVAAAVAAVIR